MGWPVVTVASGGMPVTDVTAATGRGTPVTEATNGFGRAVTKVTSGGMAVAYETLVVWPPPSGNWTTTFSGTLNTGSAGWINYNIRQWIISSLLLVNGSSVRVTLEAGAASSAVIGGVYIGHAAAAGDPYDFDGNQVQLKVGGNASFSITGGTPVVTDAVTFALDHTKNLIIAAFFNGASSINANSSFGLGNAVQYYKSTPNETSVSDVSTYASSNGTLSLVSKVEVS